MLLLYQNLDLHYMGFASIFYFTSGPLKAHTILLQNLPRMVAISNGLIKILYTPPCFWELEFPANRFPFCFSSGSGLKLKCSQRLDDTED